jgi:hypothetical protein
MTRSKARIGVVIMWIAGEAYQVFFGAFTSLQLGAPGVGDRASWAPNLLVAEAFAILPIGFFLCLWGRPWGRILASVGAVAILVVALAAALTLGREPSEALGFFALLVPPPLMLVWSVRRMGTALPAHVAG